MVVDREKEFSLKNYRRISFFIFMDLGKFNVSFLSSTLFDFWNFGLAFQPDSQTPTKRTFQSGGLPLGIGLLSSPASIYEKLNARTVDLIRLNASANWSIDQIMGKMNCGELLSGIYKEVISLKTLILIKNSSVSRLD